MKKKHGLAVKRAFFHAKAQKLVYVKPPQEDVQEGEEEMCGRLNYSMYGTRDAAVNWANEYSERLVNMLTSWVTLRPCFQSVIAVNTWVISSFG